LLAEEMASQIVDSVERFAHTYRDLEEALKGR
jgi:hypothetical protein